MARVAGRGEPVDAVTLVDELKTPLELDVSGGPVYLGTLIDAVPSAANVAAHAGIVRERADQRRVIETLRRYADVLSDCDPSDVPGLVEQARKGGDAPRSAPATTRAQTHRDNDALRPLPR
jgi:replicative DNA helicase